MGFSLCLEVLLGPVVIQDLSSIQNSLSREVKKDEKKGQ